MAAECDQLLWRQRAGWPVLAAQPLLLSARHPLQGRLNIQQCYRAPGSPTTQKTFVAVSGIIPQVMCSQRLMGPEKRNHFWTKTQEAEHLASGLLGTYGHPTHGSVIIVYDLLSWWIIMQASQKAELLVFAFLNNYQETRPSNFLLKHWKGPFCLLKLAWDLTDGSTAEGQWMAAEWGINRSREPWLSSQLWKAQSFPEFSFYKGK